MAIKTKPFDAAKYLDDAQSQIELLSDALDSGDITIITAAIGLIARAHGMSELSRNSGVTRGALYAGLKEGGNPTLDTVLKVLKVLGIGLAAKPAREMADAA